MSYPVDEETERECPFCCEYGISKDILFINKKRIKNYRKKIHELRETLLFNNLYISQEEYGLSENINWGGKTYF